MAIKNFRLTALVAFVILVLSAIPGGMMPTLSFKAGDKWGHFFAYGILSLVMLTEYAHHLRWSSKTGRWLISIVLICIGYGIMLEFLQGYLFYKRSFDVADMLANTIGVVLGTILYTAFYKKIKSLWNKK